MLHNCVSGCFKVESKSVPSIFQVCSNMETGEGVFPFGVEELICWNGHPKFLENELIEKFE